jgi:hypothetical protein
MRRLTRSSALNLQWSNLMRRRTYSGGVGMQPVFDFVAPASREEARYRAERELVQLELDQDGLIVQAREWLKAFDAALREDGDLQHWADLLDAVGDRLELLGVGNDEDDETAHERLAQLLEAPAGEEPLWGQRGKFIADIQGCRVVVRTGRSMMDLFHFELSPFDWDRPFLSDTGYWSVHMYSSQVGGNSVKEAVTRYVGSSKRKLVPLQGFRWGEDKRGRRVKVRTPPAPHPDDTDWQEGGWLHQLKAAERQR